MPSLTDFEMQAVKDARGGLAAALERNGVLGPFMALKPEQVDDIIRACIVSFQASMVRQSTLSDQIPF